MFAPVAGLTASKRILTIMTRKSLKAGPGEKRRQGGEVMTDTT
jgi:hypothetical protein